MKPALFRKVIHELGLSPRDLAGILGVPDADALRLWSEGGVPIPGPIAQRISRLLQDWRRANQIADRVIEAKVKPRLEGNCEAPKDVALTVYDARSIARLRAEEPSVSLSMHNMVNRATVMKLAKMGIPTRFSVIAEEPYAAWLGARDDGKESRALYARDVAKPHCVGLPLSASPLGQAVLRMKDIPATIDYLDLEH